MTTPTVASHVPRGPGERALLLQVDPTPTRFTVVCGLARVVVGGGWWWWVVMVVVVVVVVASARAPEITLSNHASRLYL